MFLNNGNQGQLKFNPELAKSYFEKNKDRLSPMKMVEIWHEIKVKSKLNNDDGDVVKLIHKYFEVDQRLKILNVKLKKFIGTDTLHESLPWFCLSKNIRGISAYEYTKNDCERFGKRLLKDKIKVVQ